MSAWPPVCSGASLTPALVIQSAFGHDERGNTGLKRHSVWPTHPHLPVWCFRSWYPEERLQVLGILLEY